MASPSHEEVIAAVNATAQHWTKEWMATGWVTASNGGSVCTPEFSLFIPAGAVSQDTYVTLHMTPLDPSDIEEETVPTQREMVTIGPRGLRLLLRPSWEWAEQLRVPAIVTEHLERQIDALVQEGGTDGTAPAPTVPTIDEASPGERFDAYKPLVLAAMQTSTKREAGSPACMDDAKQLARLLEGTPLEGAELTKLPIFDAGGRFAIRVKLNNVEPLVGWSLLRALVAKTGRYPLLTNRAHVEACLDMEQPFDRPRGEDEGDEDEIADDYDSCQELIDASKDADIASRVAAWEARMEEPGSTEVAVDAHLEWIGPSRFGDTLILLPTRRGWESLAFIPWWPMQDGAAGEEHIRMLHEWNRRFGAELVYHYGTVLQLVAGRRPVNDDEARLLAMQQLSIAKDTLTVGVSPRQHAAALRATDCWLLHSRP